VRRSLYDLCSLGAAVTVGATVSLLSAEDAGWAPSLAIAVTFGGFLLAALLVVASLRSPAARAAGVATFLTGLVLLVVSALLRAVPSWEAGLVSWWGVGWLARVGPSPLTGAMGAVALALGVAGWTRSMSSLGSRAGEEIERLQAELGEVERRYRAQSEQLRMLHTIDPLTGVLSRRAFVERLEEVAKRDARLSQPFALILADVDDFRRLNAENGRVAGDEILKGVARCLRSATRGTDLIGRVGNDEFSMVLAECEDARPVVQRITLAMQEIEIPGLEGASVTVSLGVVQVREPAFTQNLPALFRQAEEALDSVRGKGGGRAAFREARLGLQAPAAGA
jgi:diguanylate cyclase (GGDEF)-like protein